MRFEPSENSALRDAKNQEARKRLSLSFWLEGPDWLAEMEFVVRMPSGEDEET